MELFDCEEIQWATKDQDIMLTNHRFRVETRQGIREIQSVLLPQILGCSLKFQHYPWLIVWAVLTAALGFVKQLPQEAKGICFLVALFVFVAYFGTRRTLVLISTTSEAIPISMKGKHIAFATEIIDAIEYAIIHYQPVLQIAGEATPDGSCREPRELTQHRPQFPFTGA